MQEALRLQEESDRRQRAADERLRRELEQVEIRRRASPSNLRPGGSSSQSQLNADDVLSSLGVGAVAVAGIGAAAYGLMKLFGGSSNDNDEDD